MAVAGRTLISIRRARPSDAGELTSIAHAAKSHWGYPDELLRLWRDDLTLSPADLDATSNVFCAETDGSIVGFYSISGEDRSWAIDHMWVVPERIGSGVGRAMFGHMLGELRRAGAERLEIAADPHAEGFYVAMGARRIGDVPSTPEGRTLPLLVVDVAAAPLR